MFYVLTTLFWEKKYFFYFFFKKKKVNNVRKDEAEIFNNFGIILETNIFFYYFS